MAEIYTKEVVIANGEKLSTAADLFSASDAEWFDPSLVGIQMPTAWTTSQIDFEVSADGTTYGPLFLHTSGAQLTVPAAANARISLDPKDFVGWRYIKVRSAQNQQAERTLKLIIRDF